MLNVAPEFACTGDKLGRGGLGPYYEHKGHFTNFTRENQNKNECPLFDFMN